MKGIGKHYELREKLLNEMSNEIKQYFEGNEPHSDQEAFDAFHKKLCEIWVKGFSSVNQEIGTWGKAQKIINMTFKYLYCYDNEFCDSEYYEYFKFCHMTLDSYTLEWLYAKKESNTEDKLLKREKWSKMSDNTYYDLSKNVVEVINEDTHLKNMMCLEAEFLIWDATIIYRSTKEYQKMKIKYNDCNYLKLENAISSNSIVDYISTILE